MNDSSELLAKIKDLAEPVARREGCEIYDIEWVSGHHGKGRVLRVYLDKEGGVNLEDCANVSRGLNLILDVDDAIPGSGYYLEVSSPGLERNLRESRHFTKAVGSLIQVKLKEPVSVQSARIEAEPSVQSNPVESFEPQRGARLSGPNLRFFQGKLTRFEDPELVVELENNQEVRVQMSDILKARTTFKEEKNYPKGGAKRSAKGSKR